MGGAADGSVGAGAPGVRTTPTAPVPANTLMNKQASPGSGLYQSCVSLRERLWCVPGFGPEFLEPSAAPSPGATGTRPNGVPQMQFDPVTHLWQCFRLGTPLCKLYNQLSPRVAEIPLTVDTNLSNANACKALVMRFLIALKERLGWDPDDTFTVSQLYLNDTNGFVRVIRTVNKLLDLLAEQNLLMSVAPSVRHTSNDFLEAPVDQRMHVVRELLESERKYVHDLEIMQNFAMGLYQTGLLSADTIYLIFGNLNQLVDVQRRFLICVEDNARRPPSEQRFGGIFRDMEDDFSVYEPFCANYAQALDVISTESSALSRAKLLPSTQNWYLDPSYELPTFMIKPVQRICKYPLLLEQLMKSSPRDTPWYDELANALPVIKRITDKVNETSRQQENIQAVKDLEARVEDWKGHSLRSFGNLLLSDVFLVSKGESEREFQVYLFEKILLCCKDTGAASNANQLSSGSSRGRSKSHALLKQRQNSFSGSAAKKETRSPLQLKGRIFMNNIVGINAVGRAGGFPDHPVGTYALQVWWRGESEVESFSLKCKNDEQLRLWQGALQKLLDDLALRRQHSLSQATTPTSSHPPHPLHLNLSSSHFTRPSARGAAFMQVATPIVGTPGGDHGMPRRLCQREPSQSSQRSDDDLPTDLPSGFMTPTIPYPPARSYTETDAMALLEGRVPLDERPKPIHESWAGYTPRDPREDAFASGLVASPKSIVPQGKPATGAPSVPPSARPSVSGSSAPAGASAVPPRAQASLLARSASATPLPRIKKIPAQLVLPTDPLEQDMLGMNISSVPVQRKGMAAGRSASIPSHPGLLPMQRTSSDGAVGRAVAPEEPSTPASVSPVGGWNPYFPSIPAGPPSAGASATDNARPAGGSRTNSFSLHSSPATQRTSESSVVGPPSSRSSIPTVPNGVDPYVTTPVTPATPGSPLMTAPMQVRVQHGDTKSQVLLLDTDSFPALYEQVVERVGPYRASPTGLPNGGAAHLRLYYVDEDGDRVLMLDDEDLAMALDDSRARRRNQLDVIVD